jgi:UDP-N-acetylenolpyruvoylglucosamine reductase
LKTEGTATALDIKGKGFADLNSAHLTALVNRGYVEAKDVEVEVITTVKRKVKAYVITDEGKAYKGE